MALDWSHAEKKINLASPDKPCMESPREEKKRTVKKHLAARRGFGSEEDGIHHSDNNSKTRLLNEQFSSVFTRTNTSSLPNLGPSPHPDIKRFDVTEEGVLKLLNNLNHHKASGPDNIPTRYPTAEGRSI